MTKLVFNYDYLSKNSIPKINEILANIVDLKNISDSLNVPFDFTYYNYLKELSSKISLLKNNFETVIENIDKININLDKVMMSISDNINNIAEIKK